jgi:hypothetical protein
MEDYDPASLMIQDATGWGDIREYGEYLRDTADSVKLDTLLSTADDTTRSPRHTLPEDSQHVPQSNHISPFDWLTWRNFQFYSELGHLAPLTVGENRVHAKQSARLIDWIGDVSNHGMFVGWEGLDQVVSPPSISKDAKRRRHCIEKEALDSILRDEEPTVDQQSPQRWADELGGRSFSENSGGRNVFAQYLSQEYPHSPPGTRGSAESRVSMWSEDDTHSVVSHDNHWRRTILG